MSSQNIRNYKRLIKHALGISGIDARGFKMNISAAQVSENAFQTAREIRGRDRESAIFIHGVMPRSGTVYTGEILRLHPELHAYPNDLWEIPFLELTGDIIDIQKHFFRAYKQNEGKIGRNDFLPLFGASLMAYLHSFVPEDKRVLVKIPDVQYLDYFHTVFPNENVLLLLRDGRDVVNSTIRTWPGMFFSDVCRQWALSAKVMLEYRENHIEKISGFCWAKYEDVIKDPVAFVCNACKHFRLDPDVFPFEKIKDIAVRGSSAIKQSGKVTWGASDKPKNFNPVGRWQEWPVRKKKVFKKIAGQTLIDAGYCENFHW